jgi:CRISPR-associated protein Csb2
VVLIPTGASAEELAVLQRAIGALQVIHRNVDGTAERVHLGGMGLVSADRFWRPPVEGMRRFWRPVPALVPEVRRQQTRARRWGLADAALLSVGYVFRDRLGTSDAGPDRVAQVELVKQSGVRVHDTHALHDSRVGRYAHKTPEGITVQPYTALLDLADLVDSRTLFALGQSRHLGGGLMYPEDIAEPVARARGLL